MVHSATAHHVVALVMASISSVGLRVFRRVIVILLNRCIYDQFTEGQVTPRPFYLRLSMGEHSVEGGMSEGSHVVEGDVDDLSFLTRVVDIIGIHSLVVFESLELIHFAAQRLGCCEWVRCPNFINQDSVGVDLSNVIGLLEVVPGDLVVRGDVVAAAKPTDSQVDVRNACVHVYLHDVLIKDEHIEHEE